MKFDRKLARALIVAAVALASAFGLYEGPAPTAPRECPPIVQPGPDAGAP